jgi:hypothetical protein
VDITGEFDMNFFQMGKGIKFIKQVPWLNKHILVLSVSGIVILLFVLMIVFPSLYLFFVTILALLVAGLYLYVYLKNRRLASHGIRTFGIVVEKYETHGVTGSYADPYDAYYVTYIFTPLNGKQLKTRREISEDLYKKIFIGGPINVGFHQEEPERNFPTGGIQPMWVRVTNAIVIAVATFAGAAAVSITIQRLH